jgi:hypothetical protein
MNNGPTDDLPSLIEQLENTLQLGFRTETYIGRDQRYKNPNTEALHQSFVHFCASPDAEALHDFKQALAKMRELEKPFKFNDIEHLADAIASKASEKGRKAKPH